MTVERYKGFELERNAHGYIIARPVETTTAQNEIPYRSHEDAKRGIDKLITKRFVRVNRDLGDEQSLG
jgi:hypothetical protein